MTDTATETLDFQSELKSNTTSWRRADPLGAGIKQLSGYRYVVRLPDSDNGHETWIARDGEDWVGRCSCRGYLHHSGPCAHLCTLRKAEYGGLITVESVSEGILSRDCPMCGQHVATDSM